MEELRIKYTDRKISLPDHFPPEAELFPANGDSNDNIDVNDAISSDPGDRPPTAGAPCIIPKPLAANLVSSSYRAEESDSLSKTRSEPRHACDNLLSVLKLAPSPIGKTNDGDIRFSVRRAI